MSLSDGLPQVSSKSTLEDENEPKIFVVDSSVSILPAGKMVSWAINYSLNSLKTQVTTKHKNVAKVLVKQLMLNQNNFNDFFSELFSNTIP